MLKLKATAQTHGIATTELTKLADSLTDYINKLNTSSADEGFTSFIKLPFDQNLLNQVKAIRQQYSHEGLSYLVLIGIGGSNLGAKAIYDALQGYYEHLNPNKYPKIIFADTTNSSLLNSLNQFLNQEVSAPEKVLFIVISKSGTTTETLINLDVISQQFPLFAQRVLIISQAGSPLFEYAQQKQLPFMAIPDKIVGRFCVFSAAGLVPLSFVIDIDSLIKGASEITPSCLKQGALENPALLSACIQYHLYLQGNNISDHFYFAPELESLGKWYRQLMAESLGKLVNDHNDLVNVGITPTVSIGSIDLHSMLQLNMAGPRDKITTFITINNPLPGPVVATKFSFAKVLPEVSGLNVNQISLAIQKGTVQSYQQLGLPFMELELEQLTEAELGSFLQFKMIEITYLAKLLNINAFNQPQVELYKEATRNILAGKQATPHTKPQLGLIGLGKMGSGIAKRLASFQWEVIGTDKVTEKVEALANTITPVFATDELVRQLKTPRIIWLMLPYQQVDKKIAELLPLLEPGDTVIDGGNSYYQESVRRYQEFKHHGINFLDCGVNGGPESTLKGASLMIGGDRQVFERYEALFKNLSTNNSYGYMGASGAGHFVKMVHNGIEYGMMQAIAEGFTLLHQGEYSLPLARIAQIYDEGSIIDSALISWLGKAYLEFGVDLKGISSEVDHTGEGEWTISTAQRFSLSLPVIEKAYQFRLQSPNKPSYTGQVLSALRRMFGWHKVEG